MFFLASVIASKASFSSLVFALPEIFVQPLLDLRVSWKLPHWCFTVFIAKNQANFRLCTYVYMTFSFLPVPWIVSKRWCDARFCLILSIFPFVVLRNLYLELDRCLVNNKYRKRSSSFYFFLIQHWALLAAQSNVCWCPDGCTNFKFTSTFHNIYNCKPRLNECCAKQ